MKLIAISAQFDVVCGHTFIYPKGLAGTMSSDGQPEYDPLAPWNKEYHDAHLRIACALDRIATTLERLLKISEMSR